MSKFSIQFKTSVTKDLRDLPNKIIKSIFIKIISLQDNPFPSGMKKLIDTENYYRIRSGDYRIIYEINKKDSKIIIHYIRHRKDVYQSI